MEALRVAVDVDPYGVPEAAGETVDPYKNLAASLFCVANALSIQTPY